MTLAELNALYYISMTSFSTRTQHITLGIIIILSLPTWLLAADISSSSTADTASTTESATSTATSVATLTSQPALLSPLAQKRIKNLAANMSNRMDGVVRRLENVSRRLESRLTKLESAGADMSTARTTLLTAQTELTTATTNLRSIDTAVTNFIGSENPRENWQELKQIYAETSAALRAAHAALRLTLTHLASAPDQTETTTATSSEDAATAL